MVPDLDKDSPKATVLNSLKKALAEDSEFVEQVKVQSLKLICDDGKLRRNTFGIQWVERNVQSTEDDNDNNKKKKQHLSSSSLPSLLVDCILIDVYDEQNQVQKEFYSPTFLSGLYQNLLTPNGIIVYNFHSGSGKRLIHRSGMMLVLRILLFLEEEEKERKKDNDGCCLWVNSLDSRPNAGNIVVLASMSPFCLSS